MRSKEEPREKLICVLGLGYVGLPLLIALGKKYTVVGYDVDASKVKALSAGNDVSGELSDEDLIALKEYKLVSNLEEAGWIDVFIVAVPTPIDEDRRPDLGPLSNVSQCIGSVMKKGSIVVYESTVYPGVTEEVCLPILQETSRLKLGDDFGLGYSPERINPADKTRSLADIVKVVSGSDAKTTEILSRLYGSIVDAGVFVAKSIRVAEAAKVIENAQRDVNIAFMNELAIIFEAIGIEILDVLAAARTKWNFLDFYPGLVGGHCISVDPYYLTHKSQRMGFVPDMLLQARRVNEGFPLFVASKIVGELISRDFKVNNSDIAICGVSFKENCPDLRNSKSFAVLEHLAASGCNVDLVDPVVPSHPSLKISSQIPEKKYAAIIFLVAHNEFEEYSLEFLFNEKLAHGGFIFDLKNHFRTNTMVIS